jgi:hypothetical protein
MPAVVSIGDRPIFEIAFSALSGSSLVSLDTFVDNTDLRLFSSPKTPKRASQKQRDHAMTSGI